MIFSFYKFPKFHTFCCCFISASFSEVICFVHNIFSYFFFFLFYKYVSFNSPHLLNQNSFLLSFKSFSSSKICFFNSIFNHCMSSSLLLALSVYVAGIFVGNNQLFIVPDKGNIYKLVFFRSNLLAKLAFVFNRLLKILAFSS